MRRFLRTVVAACAFLASACADGTELPTTPTSATPSFAVQNDALADRYIVVFKRGTGDADRLTTELARGGSVHFRYRTALLGFAATLPAASLEGIRRNPNVELVEPDGVVTASGITQTGATWGLDRIDQRDLPLSGSYTYEGDGSGVTAYILDTGIRSDHSEFTGRILTPGFSAITGGTEDCNGHGTHVAGTVGGTTYGVAKRVTLVPVRVLDCQGSGTVSGVIAGIDWVANNAGGRGVANMSLGGGASSSIDAAVNNAVAAGVVFGVAGGNSNANACNYSPARAANAITVGATTNLDARASYSNYGSCLDIFAPGSSITSSWYTSSTATNTISGTSMATPHVVGAAALLRGANPSATTAEIAAMLVSGATTNKVTSAGTGSPNLLLFSSSGTVVQPPTVTVHVGSITNSAPTVRAKNWSVSVTTGVVSAGGANVSGATVAGKWNNGATVTCTTGSAGTCSLTSPNYKNNIASITWSVTAISGTNLVYNAAANVRTFLTVAKP